MDLFKWKFGRFRNTNEEKKQEEKNADKTEDHDGQVSDSDHSSDDFEHIDALSITSNTSSDDFEKLNNPNQTPDEEIKKLDDQSNSLITESDSMQDLDLQSNSSIISNDDEKSDLQDNSLSNSSNNFEKLDLQSDSSSEDSNDAYTTNETSKSENFVSTNISASSSLHSSTIELLTENTENDINNVNFMNFFKYESHKYDSSFFASPKRLPNLILPKITEDKYKRLKRRLKEVYINPLQLTTDDPKDWFEIFEVIVEDLNLKSDTEKLHSLMMLLEDDVKCRINITGLNFVPHSAKYNVIKETLIKKYEMSKEIENGIEEELFNHFSQYDILFRITIESLWIENVEGWFEYLENKFKMVGLTRESDKEFMLMSFIGPIATNCLNKTELMGFPKTGRYNIIKEILTHKFKDPVERHLALIFDYATLEKRRPSTFLNLMYDFAEGCASKEIIRRYWIERLPMDMQIAVSESFEEDDDELIQKVDMIYEKNNEMELLEEQHRILGIPKTVVNETNEEICQRPVFGRIEHTLNEIFEDMTLTDCCPSELLEKMYAVGESYAPKEVIRNFWIRRLPLTMGGIVGEMKEEKAMIAHADLMFFKIYCKNTNQRRVTDLLYERIDEE